MLCLSIRQPWLSLIISGQKDIEIRSWQPSLKNVGQRILLHAGKKRADVPLHIECLAWPYKQNTGAIVGSAYLDGVKRYEKYTDFILDEKRHFNPSSYWDGECFGFILKDVRRFYNPIPLAGKLNFFEVNKNDAIIPGYYVPATQRGL